MDGAGSSGFYFEGGTHFVVGISAATVASDGHFYVNRRPIAREKHPDWVQPPPGTYPQQGFSLVEDDVDQAASGL